jgi:hypothetical protein
MTMPRRVPPVDESHRVMLSALEALRATRTRTASSTCSTTAESLSQAKLAGVTPDRCVRGPPQGADQVGACGQAVGTEN